MEQPKLPIGWIAVLVLLLLPVGMMLQRDDPDEANPPSGAGGMNAASVEEHVSKHHSVMQDITVTERLCRLQCKSDLSAIAGLAASDAELVKESLRKLRDTRPHVHAAAWFPFKGGATGHQPIQIGTPDAHVPGAEAHWNAARIQVESGQSYESPSLVTEDGDSYVVIGVANKERGGGAVGLIHQDVLKHVAEHQFRNLRLREFPDEDGQYGIRAVDPKTGIEQDVNGPEENEGISHYKKREVVVKFRTSPSEALLDQIKQDVQALSVKQRGYAYVIDSKDWSTEQLLEYFRQYDIEYAEPHYIYVTNSQMAPNPQSGAAPVPNDELYRPYQWNLPMIHTPEGWNVSKGANGVIVAVIDTGVTLHHPDLQNRLVDGYNVIDPHSPPEDDVGHGTHVAGVVSALTDNAEGVAGMTWYNQLMPVKALDSTGMGSTYSVAEGIIWAVDHGAKIINLSLGNYASAAFLHDAIKYAYDHDVVLIAATGNDNTSQPGFPAAYPEVLAVSTTNQYDEKASFSNYGDYVDVVAPGENIASTYINNQYAALSGTSMAAPHVSALAALIRSANPQMTNAQVYDAIRATAVDLGAPGKDPYYGHGIIHVSKALQHVVGAPEPVADAAGAEPDGDVIAGGDSWLLRLLRAIFQ